MALNKREVSRDNFCCLSSFWGSSLFVGTFLYLRLSSKIGNFYEGNLFFFSTFKNFSKKISFLQWLEGMQNYVHYKASDEKMILLGDIRLASHNVTTRVSLYSFFYLWRPSRKFWQCGGAPLQDSPPPKKFLTVYFWLSPRQRCKKYEWMMFSLTSSRWSSFIMFYRSGI